MRDGTKRVWMNKVWKFMNFRREGMKVKTWGGANWAWEGDSLKREGITTIKRIARERMIEMRMRTYGTRTWNGKEQTLRTRLNLTNRARARSKIARLLRLVNLERKAKLI